LSRKAINKQMEPWADTDIKEGFRTIGMRIALDEGFVWKDGEVWMSMDDEADLEISLYVPRQIGGGYLEVRALYYNKTDTEKMVKSHNGQVLARWQGATNRKRWTDGADIAKKRGEIIAESRGCTAFKLWIGIIKTWTNLQLEPDPESWYMPMIMVEEGGDPEEDWVDVDYIQLPDSDQDPEPPTPESDQEQLKGEYLGTVTKKKLSSEQTVSLGY